METYKPFKIRGFVGKKLSGPTGIVASTLQEVICKGCAKLEIPTQGAQLYRESDGTLINDEEYFKLMQPETRLVLCEQGKKWKGANTILQDIKQTLVKLNNTNYQEGINDILRASPSEEKRLLNEFISSQRGNIDAEDRDEDAAWFKGMNQRFKTKSDVMSVKAQERVRGYFTKMKDTLKTSKENFSKASLVHYEMVLKELKDSLKANKHHGVYFMRRCDHQDRLCDDIGWFQCEGEYNRAKCPDSHMINPYSTRDNLTLFSTWNLDHVIEKQREVIPRLREAIQNCPSNKEVNSEYFYKLLFTRRNLKLVDIRCHDKGIHVGKVVKKSQFYRKPARLPRR